MINKLVAVALVALYATGTAVNPARYQPDDEPGYDLSLGVPEPEPEPSPPAAPAPPPPPPAEGEEVDRVVAVAVDALAAGADRDRVYAQLRYELGRLDVALRAVRR